MKNYSIEIELIDETGKNTEKDVVCKINGDEISKNKNGLYAFKAKFEGAEEKNVYKILIDEKELVLNLFLDLEDNKINEKKTKLSVKCDGKKVAVDRELITDSIAWDIDEKKPIIRINIISEDAFDETGDILDEVEEAPVNSENNESDESSKSDTTENEKVSGSSLLHPIITAKIIAITAKNI